ncbi:MAG: rubredoxin [Clostridia bacterium]
MEKLFKCSVCGFTVEKEAPDKCPKCGSPKEKFVELSEEVVKKIYASDRTNDIHMELITLAGRIASLCKEGIDINLDPPCVDLFRKGKDEAWTIKQRSKAELEGHMKREKW